MNGDDFTTVGGKFVIMLLPKEIERSDLGLNARLHMAKKLKDHLRTVDMSDLLYSMGGVYTISR